MRTMIHNIKYKCIIIKIKMLIMNNKLKVIHFMFLPENSKLS